MTAVLAAPHVVEAALTERGWGGGVLYGFGDAVDEDADEDADELDELKQLDDLNDDEDGDKHLDSEGNWSRRPALG